MRCIAFPVGVLVVSATFAAAGESLWIEAEHLQGIRGYCWPMGPAAIKTTKGNWGLSGPGWAAEWNQGGESGFLSIAAGADDDHAVVSKTVEIPVDGEYFVWVRYGDWREKTERFQIKLEQAGAAAWTGKFGENPVIEEDNEMKLYWGWAFGWDHRAAKLKKGPVKLSLETTTKDPEPRQVDVIVLTTDAAYRPRVKERPTNPTWQVLDDIRAARTKPPEKLLTLAELDGDSPKSDDAAASFWSVKPLARNRAADAINPAWRMKTFNDKGFLYLWNTGADKPYNWLSDDPKRVLYPYSVADEETRKEFEQKYGGQKDVPIFADPRVVPTFHGVGAGIFATDAKSGAVLEPGKRFARWLDQNPGRCWGMMMNYHPGVPVGDQGQALFAKYRDRFVGSVSGESIGYFYVDPKVMQAATAGAKTRRQLVEAFSTPSLAKNVEKYRAVYGKDIDKNPYTDVIACLSVGNICWMPICCDWGARTVGYESSTATSSILPMRWAFMRGAARQHRALTCTYRSCNFGDSSTIFSMQQSYSGPRNLLDNYYSVFAGAGMTWYKFDIWYQYMAGASMFYHEQGFDEFWKPGGTTVAGVREVQLSPKGKLVDRFLRVTAQNPQRGNPYTPIAFVVDYAHGWEPAPYWPNSFKNYHGQEDRFLFGDHEKMLEEYFWTAYHPIGRESERPITGTNEVNVPGVFGDIFDVIFAYPDVAKWRTIDTYPVVVATGDIELTDAEGRRLAQYVDSGGTLVVAGEHLTGPGAAALQLPKSGAPAEADRLLWVPQSRLLSSPRFAYRPIAVDKTMSALATTPTGDVFCVAADRGKGRLIYLSVPRGLSISRQAIPVVPLLLLHLRSGLMPIEVAGDVEWLLNRTDTGWTVTLLNPAGQDKPQQGITPTDYRQNRPVTILGRTPIQAARDLLQPAEAFEVKANRVSFEVPAGGVRLIELR